MLILFTGVAKIFLHSLDKSIFCYFGTLVLLEEERTLITTVVTAATITTVTTVTTATTVTKIIAMGLAAAVGKVAVVGFGVLPAPRNWPELLAPATVPA